MCFQRSSEGIEGKSRPPQSGWKIVPQSRTGCRETPVAKFVVCSRHEQLFRMLLEWDLSGRRPGSDRRWQLSARYIGAAPASNWCTSPAILKATRWRTGSQCSCRSTCVMWSLRQANDPQMGEWPYTRARAKLQPGHIPGRMTHT